MALTKATFGVTNISDLSSTPNATEGLTAAQLQAKFDKTGADTKTYINDTLTAELDTYFGNVSATEFGYLDGVTSPIQTQLNALKTRGYGSYNNVLTSPFTTNSSTYVDVTGVSTSITLTDTRVKIQVSAPISVNTQTGFIGISINGVDHDMLFTNGTTRDSMSGSCVVSGLTPGTYTVQMRAKTQSSSSTITINSYTTINIEAIEI